MTILGQHTVEDVEDLLKAEDYTIGQIQDAYDAIGRQWHNDDPFAEGDWQADWGTLLDRYRVAKDRAQLSIKIANATPFVRNSVVPAETEYQAILRAVTANTEGSYNKGDIQDMHLRIVAAGNKPVDFSKIPQPRQNDVDLDVYKGADDTLKALNKAADTVKKDPTFRNVVIGTGVALGVVGLIALRR